MPASDDEDQRIDQIHALAIAWNSGATSGSDYHKAMRSCADQVIRVLTDPQLGLSL